MLTSDYLKMQFPHVQVVDSAYSFEHHGIFVGEQAKNALYQGLEQTPLPQPGTPNISHQGNNPQDTTLIYLANQYL